MELGKSWWIDHDGWLHWFPSAKPSFAFAGHQWDYVGSHGGFRRIVGFAESTVTVESVSGLRWVVRHDPNTEEIQRIEAA